MFWTKDQVLKLINLYKNHPCLYAVQNTNYKNKHARNEALQQILLELKDIRENTEINEIKTKFNNLRSNFLNEHRKINSSIKIGKGTDEIYVPNLYYYEDMKFVLDHSVPRKSVNSISIPVENTEEMYLSNETPQNDDYTEIEYLYEPHNPGSSISDQEVLGPVSTTASTPTPQPASQITTPRLRGSNQLRKPWQYRPYPTFQMP